MDNNNGGNNVAGGNGGGNNNVAANNVAANNGAANNGAANNGAANNGGGNNVRRAPQDRSSSAIFDPDQIPDGYNNWGEWARDNNAGIFNPRYSWGGWTRWN